MRSAAAIPQPGPAFTAVARQPFVDGAGAHCHGLGDIDRPESVFDDTAHQHLSTVNGKSRILVRVHPGCSLGLTDFSTHQLQGMRLG